MLGNVVGLRENLPRRRAQCLGGAGKLIEREWPLSARDQVLWAAQSFAVARRKPESYAILLPGRRSQNRAPPSGEASTVSLPP